MAEETQAQAQTQLQAGRGWYVVHTQSGWEDRVRNHLESKVQAENLQKKIFQVLIPTEDVVEVKKNRKQVKKRKFFPGYLLLDMIVDNETYWVVKNISGVTGFLGEPKPRPLPPTEIQQILELTTESAAGKPKPAVQFEKGENVRITEGPFRHFIGIVEDVNEPKAKLKAMVTIFGRPTPVELDFLQVEKL
jgi:transcriptional antiterminator NusG